MSTRLTAEDRSSILFTLDVIRDLVNATTEAQRPSVEGLDPDLLPTVFTPSGNLDATKLKDFTFTPEQVDEVLAKVEEAIKTQARGQLITERAIQVIDKLKPLIPLLMAAI